MNRNNREAQDEEGILKEFKNLAKEKDGTSSLKT